MANAKIDQNSRNTGIALSSSDGRTITPIKANSNYLMVEDGTTGSENGGKGRAFIDENNRNTLCAMSSTGEIINLYINNSTGKLLIQST